MHIPFVDLKIQYNNIKNSIDTAIYNVIQETAFIGGKYVMDFENEFADLYNVKHCISCANGTDSLYIIMKMLGIGSGDEVITAANSWISSSETISQAGATPVFADVDEYFVISPETFRARITPSTKALILVHLYGQMAEVDEINKICKENNIYLIEDCAQSHFSEYKSIRAGLTGIAGSFSFYPGKNLGAYGDAGCIITNDDALAEKCKMFARHGALKKHQHQIEGINSRLDGLQAAILSAKLPHILDWTKSRIEKADVYNSLLQNIKQITLPKVRKNSVHTYHLYVILAERRDELMQYLNEKGIETALHYPTLLPLLPAYQYRNYTEADFPVSAAFSKKILSLPIYPELQTSQQEYIKDCIVKFYEGI